MLKILQHLTKLWGDYSGLFFLTHCVSRIKGVASSSLAVSWRTDKRLGDLLALESPSRGHSDHFSNIVADREFSTGCYLLT